MKNLFVLVSAVFTFASTSVFAQVANDALFDKITKSGLLCNEEIMVNHSYQLVKENPADLDYKYELVIAQKDSARCLSLATSVITSECKKSVDTLLDLGLACSSELSSAARAYISYDSRPTESNKLELAAAENEYTQCNDQILSICGK